MPKKTSRKKKYYKRAKGLFGGLSIKNILIGTAGLTVARRVNPFGGVYKPAIDKVAVGMVSNMAGFGQKDLLTAGIKEGLSIAVDEYLVGGGISILGLGNGNNMGGSL